MGNCQSYDFDILNFPSYCILDPPTPEDHERCLESWLICVRTRDDIAGTTFEHMQRQFYATLDDMHASCDDLRNTNFFILLVATLVHNKMKNRATLGKFELLKIDRKRYSCLGQAMLIVLKMYYRPGNWSDELNQSWIRTFSALMRELLKR